MTQKPVKTMPEGIKRVITGVCLACVLAALWILRGWPMRIVFVLMLTLSVWEMYSAYEHKGARPAKWVGLAYGLAVLPVYLLMGREALLALSALFCLIGMGAIVLRGRVDFDSAAATLLPILYPGLLMVLLMLMQDIPSVPLSTIAYGLAFLIAFGNDVAAYEVGRRFGRHKLCPELSPKKSVEGAVAGVIASVVVGTALPVIIAAIMRVPMNELAPLWHFSIVGLVGGVAAPIGDLSASMIKRHCGIKDYGSIFPGHGGVMDRFDSVLFSGAVVYIYFALVLNVL